MHRRPDHSKRDRVDPDTARGVLDGERARDRVQSSLCQRRQSSRRRAPRVVDEAGADVDDVAAALDEHLSDRTLSDVEEPGEVDRRDRGVLIEGVVGERLADEESGVVDQRVDPTEPVECQFDHALGGLRLGDVTRYREHVGFAGRADRARGRDDRITGSTERRCDALADALRGAGDDRDLLRLGDGIVMRPGRSRRSRLPSHGRRR